MNKKKFLIKCGTKAFNEQIIDSGGTYTIKEVSQILGLSIRDVEERRNHDLLAVQFENDICYPCWQFDGNAVVEHFAEIMAILKTTPVVGIVQFFLTKDEDLKKSPIDALREGVPKELAMIKILAKQFYQHIAR